MNEHQLCPDPLGAFDPDQDFVDLAGTFNGWGADPSGSFLSPYSTRVIPSSIGRRKPLFRFLVMATGLQGKAHY